MALTENNITSTGATTYPFTFPYLKPTDVKVSVNGTAKTYLTHWEFDTPTVVKFNTSHVPPSGDSIRIYRETDDSKLEAQFFAGSAIKSSDLNDNFTQNLYVTQESNNKIDAAWTSGDETIDSSETWHTSDDTRVATTKAIENRIDAKIDTALTTDVAAGNKITVTDNSPGSGQITVALTSGSLVNSDVNASAAIAGTKIDPQFGTQNVSLTGNITVSGTVDGRDVSVDGTKLDGIETAATADQTNAEIRAAVEAATDSNVFTDADHSKLNAIEASATADQTDAEIRTAVESATDSNVFTDADHSKLNAIEANATADQTITEIKSLIAGSPLDDSHLAANSVGDSEIVTGALDNRYYTKTTADARYFNISTGDTIKDGDTFPDNDTTIATTAAINDRIIDLVDDVGGFVPIANETSFPNANPDVNNGAGTLVSIKALASNLTSNGSGVATVANGTVGNSTVTITGLAASTTYASTFGMIVETTSTLNTYTFHRLVPKATEVTTVSGSIANVNTVANSIANVNTVASDLNEGTSEIDTVATNITNVNNVGGSIANVNTVATNINNVNDFSDKYRVASSAPTSGLDTGDLYFDTTSDELRVYNGSAWQGGVTATGNLASLGANTFTGSQTFVSSQTFDGRDVSVDGAKLDGIETGATADQTNAEIRSAVEAASDSNVFTDADHTKLNAIEANATADQTDAEIRAAVEAASDSHVFTDADHTKLNAIEAGATADQTKSDIDALNINADTVDGIHGASFLRSDADDTATGQLTLTYSSTYPLNINNGNNGKIILQGSSDPYIWWREGTTDKCYMQWATNGRFTIQNLETSKGLSLGTTLTWDGGDVWTSANDGSGSGLDADTLDGVQGASYLRTDASDSYSGGTLSIHGMGLESSGIAHNLKFKRTTSGADLGLTFYDGSNSWRMQLYATSGLYGFLDSNWGGWDIKKVPNGNFQVDEGSGLQRVVNAGNVGSGGALSSSTVYANSCHLTNTSSPLHLSGWAYFESTTSGLYWNGGSSNAWYINPNANWYMTFRSGNSGSSAIDFRTSDNTQRGYVYADNSNNLGFLDPSGSWAFNTNRGTSSCYLYDQHFYTDTNGSYDIGSSSVRWRNGYFGNKLFDGKGELRNIPQNYKTSAYTLVASDAGKHIYYSGSAAAITVPSGTFSVGDAITIISANSSTDITIVQSGTTIYNAADGSSGTRTLASKGMATLICVSSNVFAISGAGLS